MVIQQRVANSIVTQAKEKEIITAMNMWNQGRYGSSSGDETRYEEYGTVLTKYKFCPCIMQTSSVQEWSIEMQ